MIIRSTPSSLTPDSYTDWANTRSASAGIGLWRWPASLMRMQRSGPSALIASTTRVSGAWFHIGDTVQ